MVGHTIDKKYRLDAEPGAGGVGTVYRAAHPFGLDTKGCT